MDNNDDIILEAWGKVIHILCS